MLPFLSMVSASVLAGSMVLVADAVSQGFPRFTAAALRFALSSLVLVPLALGRGGLPRLPARDWGLLTVQAASGTVGFMVLFLQGVRLAGPVDAGIAAGLLPALVALTGFALLREKAGSRERAAILCASLGLVALGLERGTGGALAADPAARMLGLVCLVLAFWGDALFTVLSKRLSPPVHGVFVAAAMSGLGCLLSLGPALVETAVHGWPSPSRAGWLALVWFAAGPTVLSFLLWYWGVARSTAAQAGIAIAAMPVSAVLLSRVFLGAAVSGLQLAALALILVGFALALVPKKPRGVELKGSG